MKPTYDKHPYVSINADALDCLSGWQAIARQIQAIRSADGFTICVECYPGVLEGEIAEVLQETLPKAEIVRTRDFLRPSDELHALLSPELTDDRVFGKMTRLELADFFGPLPSDSLNLKKSSLRLVIGTGAVLVSPEWDVLIYADLARWEIQQRHRLNQMGNLGLNNQSASASEKYKCGFFVEWRVADRLKQQLLAKIDFLLDTTISDQPKMISGDLFRNSLAKTAARPFRVQPFFDPGPWGGQWMKAACDLPDGPPNYAWCFDCVPEENSLVFGFGDQRIEIPAMDLVLSHPRELLGEAVYARFGAEFPIRFDFLDTIQGGNLSLQVHPLTEFIQQHFGMNYTQDESYYLLSAEDDACVYLGLKENVDRHAMVRDLHLAQQGRQDFPTDLYVNRWPAKTHDHFSIPAGTIHCSGRNSMVLEISATPYIFTFKLWDWGRLGMDGRPRPIHLEHGLANIQWDRTTDWVKANLIGQIETISEGLNWKEERTGLDRREFIETRRHWFTGPVVHDTLGGVNVLNLVQGSEVTVDSPNGVFAPMVIHYAETFIVPAAVGEYRITPSGDLSKPFATIKAFVRTNP